MSGSMLLGALMACTAVAFGSVAGWLIAAIGSLVVDRLHWSGRSRATLIAQLRLLPLAGAVVFTLAQGAAFIRFEQTRHESAGPLLISLACIGVALMADAVWRASVCWRRTIALLAEWRDKAAPLVLAKWQGPAWVIRPAFPIVAVVGVLRPQLFVARQVVEHCSATELAAIAAHEAAHVAARDNLLRLLFAMTPGARLFRAVASELEHKWLIAAEEAADESASHDAGALELASALTKVARLAPASPTGAAAASALIGVSDLDGRVRRLLRPHARQRVSGLAWLPAGALFVTTLLTHSGPVSASLHELFELLVRSH